MAKSFFEVPEKNRTENDKEHTIFFHIHIILCVYKNHVPDIENHVFLFVCPNI
jgi:hypothetical protein